MFSWLTTLRQSPRQPLAGVALAAVAGIGAAEAWRAGFLPRYGDGSTAAGVAASLFATLAAVWWSCRRRRPALATALFWCAVTTVYAALHLFGSDPVPAGALARRLALPAVAVDPEDASAHVLRATGTVLDLPRRTPAPDGGANWRFTAGLETAGIDGRRRAPARRRWPWNGATARARWPSATGSN